MSASYSSDHAYTFQIPEFLLIDFKYFTNKSKNPELFHRLLALIMAKKPLLNKTLKPSELRKVFEQAERTPCRKHKIFRIVRIVSIKYSKLVVNKLADIV